MCFVWISEQTAQTNTAVSDFVFYSRDGKCLLRDRHWVFK